MINPGWSIRGGTSTRVNRMPELSIYNCTEIREPATVDKIIG
jgi:hypothetical protein